MNIQNFLLNWFYIDFFLKTKRLPLNEGGEKQISYHKMTVLVLEFEPRPNDYCIYVQ